ncbi:MAG: cache domain-containing protein, partial [Halanaerobiales bacterium]
MFFKNLSIKMKLSLTVIIIVLILTAFLSFYSIKQSSNLIKNEEKESLFMVGDHIQTQMNNQLESARMSVSSIANNPEIQRLFAERNREELENRLLPAYQEISDEVAQFQFHEPDSSSFLRLHAPDEYGDSLKDFRHTVNEANEKEKTVMGLEEGRGGFGFRVVVPVSYEDEHIGTVEYGSSFNKEFLENIQKEMNGEYFIYIFEDAAGVAWDAVEDGRLGATTEDNWDIEDEEMISQIKNGERVFSLSENEDHRILLQPFTD